MNRRYGFILLAILIGILSKDFVIYWMRKFYLFELDRTGTTRGVVLNAKLDDAINGTSVECSYSYSVNDRGYRRDESISVHDTVVRFNIGDSLDVRYNIARPWQGTIDNRYNLRLFFAASLGILIWFIWAIVSFVIEIVRFIKIGGNRNSRRKAQ